MANLRKDIDLYLQKLLALQFKASSNISHKPTKGSVREKFIKQVVKAKSRMLRLLPEHLHMMNGNLLNVILFG